MFSQQDYFNSLRDVLEACKNFLESSAPLTELPLLEKTLKTAFDDLKIPKEEQGKTLKDKLEKFYTTLTEEVHQLCRAIAMAVA